MNPPQVIIQKLDHKTKKTVKTHTTDIRNIAHFVNQFLENGHTVAITLATSVKS